MQLLKNCICPTIRIGRESWCLPYAGFFIAAPGFAWVTNHIIEEKAEKFEAEGEDILKEDKRKTERRGKRGETRGRGGKCIG